METVTMRLEGYGKTKRGADIEALETVYNSTTEFSTTWARKVKKDQPAIEVSQVSWFIFE